RPQILVRYDRLADGDHQWRRYVFVVAHDIRLAVPPCALREPHGDAPPRQPRLSTAPESLPAISSLLVRGPVLPPWAWRPTAFEVVRSRRRPDRACRNRVTLAHHRS